MTTPEPAPDRLAFEHRTLPQRVLFGSGSAAEHLRAELRRQGALRPMVVVTSSSAGTARRRAASGRYRPRLELAPDPAPGKFSTTCDHPSVASVLYTGPGRSTALLVVGDASRQELAYSGVFMQWQRTTDGGRDWFVSTSGEGSYALWFDDEHAFWLRLSADDVPELLRLAATVRPATDTEWAAIPTRPEWDGPPIITG